MSHFINMDYQSAYKLAKQHPNDETALTILIQSIKNLTINEYKYDLIDLIDHNEGVKKVFDNLKPEIQTLYRDVKESIENDSILKRKRLIYQIGWIILYREKPTPIPMTFLRKKC